MKHAPHLPTAAELRAAYDASSLAARGIPFEAAMADRSFAIVLRNLAQIRARRAPAAPEAFELTP